MKKGMLSIVIVTLFITLATIPAIANMATNKEIIDLEEKVTTLDDDITIHVYVKNEKTNLPISGVDIHMEWGKPPKRSLNHQEKTTNEQGYCKFEGDFTCRYPLWDMMLCNYKPRWRREYEHIQTHLLTSGSVHRVYFIIERSSSGKSMTLDLLQQNGLFELIKNLSPNLARLLM